MVSGLPGLECPELRCSFVGVPMNRIIVYQCLLYIWSPVAVLRGITSMCWAFSVFQIPSRKERLQVFDVFVLSAPFDPPSPSFLIPSRS